MLGLFTTVAVQAQAPAWQQAVTATNAAGSYSSGRATATDASGNVYIAGDFTGTVSFGNTTLTTVGAASNTDVFVAKWSSATNSFIWAQQAGGLLQEGVQTLAINGSSIYVGGFFESPAASFGSNTLTNAGPATGSNSRDIFVAKLTDNGTTASFTWAQQAGSTSYDTINSLVVSGSNVYFAGDSSGGPQFGSVTLPATGTISMYVAKLIDAGPTSSFAWVQQAGAAIGPITASTLAVNGTSLYVGGYFYGVSVLLGSIRLYNADTNGYNCDTFVAKLTDAGSSAGFTWVTRFGGTTFDRPLALTANGLSLYVAGYYGLGTTTIGSTVLPNPTSSFDVYVAKLTDMGANSRIDWAQRAGGPGDDIPYAIAVNGSNVYVTGGFRGATADFGSTTLTNFGFVNIFLAKLLDTGTNSVFSWAQSASGQGYTSGVSMAMRGANIYVSGTTSPPSSFGSFATPGLASSSTAYWAMLTDNAVLGSVAPTTTAGISIYPNPAHTTVTVVVPPMQGTGQAVIILSDALGRTVFSRTSALPVGGLRYSLALAGLPAGLYALKMQVGTVLTVRRLVIRLVPQ